MSVFFNALTAVVLLLMLMGTGCFMGHRGWMGQREKTFLGAYIINIAVPCTCIVGLTSNLNISDIQTYSTLVITGAISVGGALLLSVAVTHFLPLPRKRRGVFGAMAGLSNCIFVGVPMVTQIFGDEGILYLMIFYLSNTICLQVFGMMMVRNSGDGVTEGVGLGATLLDLFKKPPVIGILISLTIILLDVTIPSVLWNYMSYIGNTVTPLALIYCGFILYDLGLKNLRPMELHWLMLVIRLVLAPLLTWGVVSAIGITGLPRSVFTLMAGLPVVSQVPVYAGTFGADEEYAAVGACLSTVLCCVSIPILVVLMELAQ